MEDGGRGEEGDVNLRLVTSCRLPQCFSPARHLHRSDGEDVPNDHMRGLARDGLQDMGQLLQLSGGELLGVNHVEGYSVTDIAVAVPQMFDEIFSDAELHIGNEEGD